MSLFAPIFDLYRTSGNRIALIVTEMRLILSKQLLCKFAVSKIVFGVIFDIFEWMGIKGCDVNPYGFIVLLCRYINARAIQGVFRTVWDCAGVMSPRDKAAISFFITLPHG